MFASEPEKRLAITHLVNLTNGSQDFKQFSQQTQMTGAWFKRLIDTLASRLFSLRTNIEQRTPLITILFIFLR